MATIPTLYDVLKVSRDAPTEVVRASYKALSQKYHPDRNPGDPSASAAMQRINHAYAVLSVPEKRRQHDLWVVERERESSNPPHTHQSQESAWKTRTDERPKNRDNPNNEGSAQTGDSGAKRFWMSVFATAKPILTLGAILGAVWAFNQTNEPRPKSSRVEPVSEIPKVDKPIRWEDYKPYDESTDKASRENAVAPEKRKTENAKWWEDPKYYEVKPSRDNSSVSGKPKATTGKPWEKYAADSAYTQNASAKQPSSRNSSEDYQRLPTAPNGSPWPATAAYVVGYDKLNARGYSKVTVDNSQNDSDVFVKLNFLDVSGKRPVRHIFIPARKRFTMNKINAGQYDVRYMDLDTGAMQKSEPFELKQTTLKDGIQFSELSLTLYKVRNGNMQTYVIGEDEF